MNQKHAVRIVNFIKNVYKTNSTIPLHAPTFNGNEQTYVNECLLSTMVSSVGPYVTKIEDLIKVYTGAQSAVAVVNGTSALHLALVASEISPGDEVLMPAITFVATANAIRHTGAEPIFIDIEQENLGLCPKTLLKFLKTNSYKKKSFTYNKKTHKRIFACIAVHIFGHPAKIQEIEKICQQYNIMLLEDAAEALGSFLEGKHLGRFGKLGAFSFNGNKIITSGGGGIIITDDTLLGKKIKHMSTTAKQYHDYEYIHDMTAYNYRMPNINAALACAQMEQLEGFIDNKRTLSKRYQRFFSNLDIQFVAEPNNTRSNYWLNAIICKDRQDRDYLLNYAIANNISMRPLWKPLHTLSMYQNNQKSCLKNALWLYERVVCLPSSPCSPS